MYSKKRLQHMQQLISVLNYSHYSKNCLRLTHEQLRIVNHKTEPGDIVKIVAFAGLTRELIMICLGIMFD